MRKKAFTLIELLVVISIIALLLSILMPSLGKAKELSRRVVCASNLHQMAFGLQLYCEDNNGRVPSDGFGVMRLGGRSCEMGRYNSNYSKCAAFRKLNQYCGGPYSIPEGADERGLWDGSTSYDEFLSADDDAPLFKCPSDKGSNLPSLSWLYSTARTTYKAYGSSYAYNLMWGQDGITAPTLNNIKVVNGTIKSGDGFNILNIRRPSFVVFAADHTIQNFMYDDDRDDKWHDRKKPTANIVFVDGHVDYFEVKPGHTNKSYTLLPIPSWWEKVGWRKRGNEHID